MVGEQPPARLLEETDEWPPERSLLWKTFVAMDSGDGVSHRVLVYESFTLHHVILTP